MYTSSLIEHLKAVEPKEGNTPKRSRSQEITKLRVEINHIEMKNYIQNQKETTKKPIKQNKTKTKTNKQTNKQKNPGSSFFEKNQQLR